MADLIMQTPLNGQLHTSNGLTVKEAAPCGKVTIRGEGGAVSAALQSVTALTCDMQANTFSHNAEYALYWLGPDEWLVYCNDTNSVELAEKLIDTLPQGESAVVDVSDYYTVIQVAGTKARAALASGTPLDIHPRVFKPGQCAQTRFGNASILLSCQSEDTYDVQIRWSFAEYVWKYLCKVGVYV